MVFLNPFMVVVTKGHTYLNKPRSFSWRIAEVSMTFCYGQALKGRRVFWKILRSNHTKSEAFCPLCTLKKRFWKFSGNSYKIIHDKAWLEAHSYTEHELCRWGFSINFPKIFRTAVLNERLPINIPYFIKEHLWMSASDEVTLTKISGGRKPSSK